MNDNVKLLLAAALTVALGACASRPPVETAGEAAAKKSCVRETGTRIPTPEGKCVNASGRVYTGEEIQHTGSPTLGEALRRIRH